MSTRHTTTMDEVERIKADIAKLPEVYRPLLSQDMPFVQRYGGPLSVAALILGMLIGHCI